jgi:hypothetical protein
VEDSSGNLLINDFSNVTLTLNAGTFANGSQSITVQAIGGIATFTGLGGLVINTSGNYQLWASDGTARGAASSTFTINPSAASQMVFRSVPTTGTAGVALAPAVKVAVEDAFGNIETGDTSMLTLGIATGPGTFTSGSTLSAAAVGGIATFNNLTLNTSGTYTLNSADGLLAVPTSGAIAVKAAAATHLALLQTAGTGTAGTALAPAVKVGVEDKFGNLVTTSSTVTFSLNTGTFSNGVKTAAVGTVGGIATFSSLIINTAGSYTFNATDGALTGVSFSATINPGAASKLVFQQAPASGTAGVVLSPAVVVAVEDKQGNLISSDSSSSMTLTLSTGTFANGSKTVTTTVTGGRATFSGPGLDLIINKSGSYKLTASDGTLTAATSGNIAVGAAAATKLAFQSIPVTGTAGVVIATAVKVAVEDVYGNVVTGDASTINLAIATGPGNFTSGSTLSLAAVNGIATFSNLVLNTSGKYTLNAINGSLTVPTSGTFTIVPAAASKVVFQSEPPASGMAGVALSPAITVAVEDQFGNLVTSASTVTLTLSSGTFSTGISTVSAATSGGIAKFSNLIIKTAGAYTLLASSGTLTTDTSTTFTIV